MEKKPLTARQREWYNALLTLWRRNLRSPTYRELTKEMGVSSTNATSCVIQALRKKGWLVPVAKGRSHALQPVGLKHGPAPGGYIVMWG